MENQPVPSTVEQYLINVTGSGTDPNAEVTEAPKAYFTRRSLIQGFLGFAGVKSLEGKTDPCPSPPCKYKMGD